jgi:kinesin family protein 2/24
VKSLSKGNNSKKDVLSSNFNLKESITVPLSSVTAPAYEDYTADTWRDENEGDDFSPPEEYYEQVKPPSKKNVRMESYAMTDDKLKKPSGLVKWKDLPKPEPKPTNSEDDLSALLQVICWLPR